MKAILLALILLSAIVGVATFAEPHLPESAPYSFTLVFPDNSLELCSAYSYSIDGYGGSIYVKDCQPDKIFQGGFDE